MNRARPQLRTGSGNLCAKASARGKNPLLGRCLGGVLARAVIRLRGEPGRFAAALAQIVELGTPDLAATHHGDLVDIRRVQREDALDTLAKADLADGEARADAMAPVPGDADAFIVLDSRTRALGHAVADAERVARCEIRDVAAELGQVLGFELLQQVHGAIPSFSPLLRY